MAEVVTEPAAFVIGGKRGCRHCERWLKQKGDLLYCPCCGEVTMFMAHVVGSAGPDADGFVNSGMVLTNRGTCIAQAPKTHPCPTPRAFVNRHAPHSLDDPIQQQLFG